MSFIQLDDAHPVFIDNSGRLKDRNLIKVSPKEHSENGHLYFSFINGEGEFEYRYLGIEVLRHFGSIQIRPNRLIPEDLEFKDGDKANVHINNLSLVQGVNLTERGKEHNPLLFEEAKPKKRATVKVSDLKKDEEDESESQPETEDQVETKDSEQSEANDDVKGKTEDVAHFEEDGSYPESSEADNGKEEGIEDDTPINKNADGDPEASHEDVQPENEEDSKTSSEEIPDQMNEGHKPIYTIVPPKSGPMYDIVDKNTNESILDKKLRGKAKTANYVEEHYISVENPEELE